MYSHGSIPACAGEPFATVDGTAPIAVYPRVCGGTPAHSHHWRLQCGLSPRVRGNPLPFCLLSRPVRSIPACAGEPACPPRRRKRPGVYPRVCGGTTASGHNGGCNTGLSPRVRGNRCYDVSVLSYHRSIPACAGEPMRKKHAFDCARVYPRVCGGTSSRILCPYSHTGLSPRVRGNQMLAVVRVAEIGSIPACAGEPCAVASPSLLNRVYPRVCGGTSRHRHRTCIAHGLSPRVRGNPAVRRKSRAWSRSIPACAGEPGSRYMPSCSYWVYPRVCGGTARWRVSRIVCMGLSPRVRGNRDAG